MTKGQLTPLEQRERFRAHYLYSGNASAAAREVDLPESTGRDIARELRQDDAFVEARRDLRDRALEDLVVMRMQLAEVASERFHGEPDRNVGPDGSESISDNRPQYGRLVLDAEKNAQNLAKISGPAEEKPVTVNVRISGPVDELESDNGQGA